MKILRAGPFFIFLFVLCSAHAIDLTRINSAWQYDSRTGIELKNRVVRNGDSLTVFLRVRSDTVPNWSMAFLIQDDYKSVEHSTLTALKVDTLLDEPKKYVLQLDFLKPGEDLLVVELSKGETRYYYDINLRIGSLPYSSIYPEDAEGLPIFEPYLSTSSFRWTGSPGFHALAYVEKFPFADPPMAEMKPLAPSVLPDSSFTFVDPVAFRDDYFYVVRTDSNASVGVTMLKVPPYYPEYKMLDELIASMYYLLNEPERRGMKNSRNPKKSFNSFWINTYSTKYRARNAIRNYFNRVEKANRLFTDFKQGWKTDRGMLFIVFGAPDEVYRTGNSEEWYYDGGHSFEFTILSTFFAPRTYALRKRRDYETLWFESIATIRQELDD